MSDRKRILCITSNGEEVIFGTIRWTDHPSDPETRVAFVRDERDPDDEIRLVDMDILEVSDAPDEDDEPWDGFRHDGEADADALASAGLGTDEDYGGDCERF